MTDVIDLLGSLPEIGATLRSINRHVTNLDTEVVMVRRGVEALETEVSAMRTELGALRAEVNAATTNVQEMSGHVGHMAPQVEALGRLASPLRLGRRRGREAEREEELVRAAALAALNVPVEALAFEPITEPPFGEVD